MKASNLVRLFTALAGWLFLAPAATASIENLKPPPITYATTPTGVNLQDGSFTYATTDLTIGPADLGLKVERGYLGQNGLAYSMGASEFGNWYFGFNVYLYETIAEVIGPNPGTYIYDVHIVRGASTVNFQRQGANRANAYTNEDGSAYGSTLAFDLGTETYTFTDPEGTIYTFPVGTNGRHGRVQTILFPNGLRHDYSYASAVHSLFTNSGYALIAERSGSVDKVCVVNLGQTYVAATSACPVGASAVTYTWGPGGHAWDPEPLLTFTNAAGVTTSYEYSGGLSCIREPSTGPCKITNVYGPAPSGYTCIENERVTSQTTATGEAYGYQYQSPNTCPQNPPNMASFNPQTTYTTPAGNYVAVFGLAPRMTAYTDPLNRTTQFGYANPEAGYPWVAGATHITYPEGNAVQHSVDYRGNFKEARQKAKPGTLADIFSTAFYPLTCANPKTCNKPEWTEDAKGNRTDYTYDPGHGGVLTATGPAVNGVRPQTRYTYVQRYARIKNSSGTIVNAASPIWLVATEEFCRTSSASGTSCTSSNDETATTYDYGPTSGTTPNNLLLRGKTVQADGVTLRTCYRYDSQGNKISETAPRAGLSSCP